MYAEYTQLQLTFLALHSWLLKTEIRIIFKQEKDRGRYRCRVDFDKAPAKIYKVALQVVGK